MYLVVPTWGISSVISLGLRGTYFGPTRIWRDPRWSKHYKCIVHHFLDAFYEIKVIRNTYYYFVF